MGLWKSLQEIWEKYVVTTGQTKEPRQTEKGPHLYNKGEDNNPDITNHVQNEELKAYG